MAPSLGDALAADLPSLSTPDFAALVGVLWPNGLFAKPGAAVADGDFPNTPKAGDAGALSLGLGTVFSLDEPKPPSGDDDDNADSGGLKLFFLIPDPGSGDTCGENFGGNDVDCCALSDGEDVATGAERPPAARWRFDAGFRVSNGSTG